MAHGVQRPLETEIENWKMSKNTGSPLSSLVSASMCIWFVLLSVDCLLPWRENTAFRGLSLCLLSCNHIQRLIDTPRILAQKQGAWLIAHLSRVVPWGITSGTISGCTCMSLKHILKKPHHRYFGSQAISMISIGGRDWGQPLESQPRLHNGNSGH